MIDDSNLNKNYFTGLFYYKGHPLNEGPSFGMTMRSCGSMRFRWNEENPNRESFLKNLEGTDHKTVAVELIHSQTVFAVDSPDDVFEMQGDGIITKNKRLIPVVTVADCMPIYIYDPVKEVFGMLHSGWKGTGIVRNAIELSQKKYGSKPEDFCVVMGPHIHDCCYFVGQERAQYFRVNFTGDCVTEEKNPRVSGSSPVYRLSLAKANLSILRELGIDEDSVVVYNDCTCCNQNFGSFRRETSSLPQDMSIEEKQKHFTVQAAWVKF